MTTRAAREPEVNRIETAVTAIRHAVHEGWFSIADGEVLIDRLRNPVARPVKPGDAGRTPP